MDRWTRRYTGKVILLFAIATAFVIVAVQPRIAWSDKISYLGCYAGNGNFCGIPQYPYGMPYSLYQQIMADNGEIEQSQQAANVANPNASNECGLAYKPLQQFVSKNINIPSRCADIDAALAYEGITSATKSTFINYLFAHGSYALGNTSRLLNHPFGDQFTLTGDAADKTQVTFTAIGVAVSSGAPTGMFLLTKGHKFGKMTGFTYNGPGKSLCAANCSNTTGYNGSIFLVAADSGSVGIVGPEVTINDAYAAVNPYYGATIYADGIKATGGADGTIWAYGNGTVLSCVGCDLSNSATPKIYSGSAALSDTGAQIIIDSACLHDSFVGLTLIYNGSSRNNSTRNGRNCSNAVAANTTDINLVNTSIYNIQGQFTTTTTSVLYTFTDNIDQLTSTGVNWAVISNGGRTQFQMANSTLGSIIGVNNTGFGAFNNTAGSTDQQMYFKTQNNKKICGGPNETQRWCLNTDGSVQTTTTTVVGSLPTCNAAESGAKLVVTDALAPTYLTAVVGGGAIVSPVLCNGAAWVAD